MKTNLIFNNRPKYDATKQQDLLLAYKKNPSNEIKEKIILNNLGLIGKLASRMRLENNDFDDYMQIGALAVSKAIEYYDISRGVKFSTFAAKYIFNAMMRNYLETGKIHVPVNLYYDFLKINSFIAKFEMEHAEQTPTDEQIAQALNMTPYRVNTVRHYNTQQFFSLDDEISVKGEDGQRRTLLDTIPDENSYNANKLVDQLGDEAKVEYIMRRLQPREKYILTEVAMNEKKATAIAKEMGLSRQRISDIYMKTIRKARKILVDYNEKDQTNNLD